MGWLAVRIEVTGSYVFFPAGAEGGFPK